MFLNKVECFVEKNVYLCGQKVAEGKRTTGIRNKYITTMCTVNMTFEVPETKHINIEALKQKINAMVLQLIANPTVEVMEKSETPRLSQRLRGIAKAVPAGFDYKEELESRF